MESNLEKITPPERVSFKLPEVNRDQQIWLGQVTMTELAKYDKLECPDCEKICKPVKVLKNGTVVYEKHDCINSNDHSFKIDIEGNLIE